MGRKNTSIGIMTPVIRKLIRRDEAFLCSICRSEYETSLEANNCLNHCWFDLRNFYPVVLRRGRFGSSVFRCHFCCRDYVDEGDALDCARRCLRERNRLHMREQLLNDLPLEAPSKRPSRIRIAQMRTPPALRRFPATEAPMPESTPPAPPPPEAEGLPVEAKVEAETPPPQESPATAPEALVVKDRGRHKDSFPKQWVRHDAKYKCSFCSQTYFTKMEVETCFQGHFDEEGYEKSSEQ